MNEPEAAAAFGAAVRAIRAIERARSIVPLVAAAKHGLTELRELDPTLAPEVDEATARLDESLQHLDRACDVARAKCDVDLASIDPSYDAWTEVL